MKTLQPNLFTALACLLLAGLLSPSVHSRAAGRRQPRSPEEAARASCAWWGRQAGQDAAPLSEGFSFIIRDLKMEHQSEVNNLNIRVCYSYVAGLPDAEYPDFRPILKDIENYLAGYPNEADYWEIVNKRLTLMVLRKYPAVASITAEIAVSPSAREPYERSSIVSRNRRPPARARRAGRTR